MQDKTFSEAVQELHDRISSNVQESMHHMLLYRTTATNATLHITDDTIRTVVTNELITDQLIALLNLIRDLGMIDRVQHEEFKTYLLRALAIQHNEATKWDQPEQ
ncbi:hypothetical protein KDA_37640 [Dictyobacter alpinus]|uniref:Uncharacterized protein n=1 Tax=Dictyobacter alpinus TaxID=2014873 RepID=A0A402BAE1_9CHLR|nr:hypothetical protein [Dictyobacter alpinus]GCE28280.1 hypothetical protein KDA_37640 [Dictyobacter alpinus]